MTPEQLTKLLDYIDKRIDVYESRKSDSLLEVVRLNKARQELEAMFQ